MPKPSSTHVVDRFLERRLRVVPPGGALPSVRQVMDACRVGPKTVTDVVRGFERRKLIVAQPKRGLFRSDEAHVVPAVDLVDVLYLNADAPSRAMVRGEAATDGSFHGELITAIRRAAADRDIKLRMHVPGEGEDDADLVERIASDPSSRACLTVSLTDPSLLRPLVRGHLGVVNLFPASFQLPPNAITSDSDEVIRKQLGPLLREGHRRIAYLHNVEDHHLHRDILLRREAFFRQAVEHDVELHPGYVRFAGFEAQGQREAVAALLGLAPQPTAVICADQHLPAVYEVAAGRGLVIGRDLSVVGTDDKPIAMRVDPPASSLRVHRDAAARDAFDLLDGVAHGRCVASTDYRRATLKMMLRRSIGPVPHD